VSFSPTQAALEGFRLIRRRPASFLVWSVLVGAAMGAFLAGFAYAFQDIGRLFAENPSVDQLLATAARFLGLWLAGALGMLLIMSVLVAAIYRATLMPAQRAFAYLRLGGAELRLIVLQLLVMLAAFSCELIAFGAGVAVATAPLLMAAKVGIIVAIVVAAIVLAIFLLTRLCLLGPVIVARRRLGVSEAWALTRGRFWSLFGMGLLTFVLAMGVSVLAQALIQPFTTAALGPAAYGVSSWPLRPVDPFAALRSHPVLFAVFGVLAMPALGLQMVVQITPFAAAYRELSEPA
jgi:hypothetical protein